MPILILGWLFSAQANVDDGPQWIAPETSTAPTPEVTPSWVWVHRPDQPTPTLTSAPVGPVWLARTFDVPSTHRSVTARLALAADNRAVAFLNGVEVLRSEDWSRLTSTAITLRSGLNALAIRAENGPGAGDNPAGVLVLVEAKLDDGTIFCVVTDEQWRGAPDCWEGWPAAPAPEGSAPVVVLGPAQSAPWKLDTSRCFTPRPCPLLRDSFTIEGQPARATVQVVGLGHYELRLNGHVVGDTLVNQTWSQYNKTLYRQEFDVTSLLRTGENVWSVLLGNSFWWVAPANDPGRFVKTDAMPDFSSGRPYLLWLESRIETADGKEIVVTSDSSWRWADGPLTFSHIYAGEDYDARLERPGWDKPGFDDKSWRPVQTVKTPPVTLLPLEAPGIKAFEVFQPTGIREPEPGIFTYVFEQNCSALLRFTVRGPRGRTVRFKPCEYMDSTGRVRFTYTWGTGKDIWHDYTLRGDGPETHQVLFCYVGCQYVEVTGAVPKGRPNPAGLPVVEQLELVHTRAANRTVGHFLCSCKLQNRIHEIIEWAVRSNMSHVPTDCPHREKNGWQEQTWHMARAISYRYDIHDWYRKIARDLRDTQLPDGHIPTNCPNYLVGIPPHGFWNEAPEWGVAGVLVPWHLYEWYGNRDALAAGYASMKAFVDYLTSQAEDGVITSNLGDWYDCGHDRADGPSYWTPLEVSATAIWALGASTVARAADVLDRPADAARYKDLFEQIRSTFQKRFWDTATKTVKNNGSCQAANAAALCIDLVPREDRAAAVGRIVDDIERRDWQQTTGEVLHVFLIRALADAGRADILHRVYARRERGSYGYMVASGLTTLPESWNAKPGTGNSMNHFMLGHLVEWHFAYVAGIRQQPGGVGWRKVLIAPHPGPLDHAEAAFQSPTGRITSKWRRSKGVFELTVEIPQDVEAVAVLPDGTRHDLAAGQTKLRCPDDRSSAGAG
ncbi:MAG: family 78 glycoside hydrolase catalytic domain [Phycisphaerales bacterium]|nr:MAG: family 78 glycoside hydrolase catalytic domain [Phycisphaerales bacterium]